MLEICQIFSIHPVFCIVQRTNFVFSSRDSNQAFLHNTSSIEDEFSFTMMDYVWERTALTSPLRRCVLDQIIWESTPEAFYKDAGRLSSEVRLEIIKAINRAFADVLTASQDCCLQLSKGPREY
jgi:hypothetical protein